MIETKCSECGKVYKLKDGSAGKKYKCECGATFRAPAAAEESPPASQDPAPPAPSAPAPAATSADLAKALSVFANPEPWSDSDLAKIENLKAANDRIMGEIRKIVVGMDKVVHLTMIGLFGRGHCLLMGVPGLGKTLLVSTLASSLSLKFKRVQFTPDLMPSDITGSEVIQEDKATGERHFRFLEGPIFTNMLLADEINRTPPKTQAALLEAMQERQVTVGGERRDLDRPFFVLATQNPIEQEGTYPLPEAQLDRFMFLINVGYPNEEEEKRILALTTSGYMPEIQSVLSREEIVDLQDLVRKVNIGEDVVDFILTLVRATRSQEGTAPDFIKKWVTFGASPRASQNLVIGAKAVAILDGRNQVRKEDVLEVAHAVLGHRIIPNFAAEAEGVTQAKIVDQLLEVVA
ncbi:MAG: AAA family ATPase [Planctomycetota bacterium]|jgi:MoxR-like ATPase